MVRSQTILPTRHRLCIGDGILMAEKVDLKRRSSGCPHSTQLSRQLRFIQHGSRECAQTTGVTHTDGETLILHTGHGCLQHGNLEPAQQLRQHYERPSLRFRATARIAASGSLRKNLKASRLTQDFSSVIPQARNPAV